MPMPRDLESLFREAGEALAAKRVAARAAERERQRKRRERERRLRADRKRAPAVANEVWAWVVGEEARELCALMRSATLDELTLLGWLSSDGSVCKRGFSGAWEIRLAETGALVVFHLGMIGYGGIGTTTSHIECAADLARIAPPRVVFAFAHAIESRAVLDYVRADLRDYLE